MSNDIWMGQWRIFWKKRGKKNLLLRKWKSSVCFFFFSSLLGCVNKELLWVSGHYTHPNEEIFVNVLYVKYNPLPLPPLGLFPHPSLKPVIFLSQPNCLSFLSAYYQKHTACFWRDFARRWHKVYLVLPVASHWIICADNVQSTHANEVIPPRSFSRNVNFGGRCSEWTSIGAPWAASHPVSAFPNVLLWNGLGLGGRRSTSLSPPPSYFWIITTALQFDVAQ